MARRCARRAMTQTSWPAFANSTAIIPPIAPAPYTQNLIETPVNLRFHLRRSFIRGSTETFLGEHSSVQLVQPRRCRAREALDLIMSDHFSRSEPGVFAPIRHALYDPPQAASFDGWEYHRRQRDEVTQRRQDHQVIGRRGVVCRRRNVFAKSTIAGAAGHQQKRGLTEDRCK
jgi:hypothetical protein